MTRILIAEDDAEIRALLQQALACSDLEFTFVNDGTEALKTYGQALLAGQPFCLLVLDCSMPRMSGVEVVKRVRELGDERTLLCFLTAHAKEMIADDVLSYNVMDVWEKPGALVNLEERIRKLVNKCGDWTAKP